MLVDPMQAMATASLPLATSSVSPIPTVVPTLPEYQDATETGTRTLWYVYPSSSRVHVPAKSLEAALQAFETNRPLFDELVSAVHPTLMICVEHHAFT